MAKGLKVETAMHATDVADLLSQISVGLIEGALVVRSEGGRHVFHPGQLIRLGLRAHESDNEGRMQIEIAWQVPLHITPDPIEIEGSANGANHGSASREDETDD